MAATREALEAVIREQLSHVAISAVAAGVPLTSAMNQAAETILSATDEYVTAEVGLLTPAERRQILSRETS
jgi:hypothetical protein